MVTEGHGGKSAGSRVTDRRSCGRGRSGNLPAGRGWSGPTSDCVALSGLRICKVRNPMAMPWADEFRPFGAEEQYSFPAVPVLGPESQVLGPRS